MSTKENNFGKWVGLVEVSQKEGAAILGIDRGAHVTIIAWCRSEIEFRSTIQASLTELELEFVDAEEIETCDKRMREYSVSDEFVSRMSDVGPEIPVVFMEFHTFPLNEE